MTRNVRVGLLSSVLSLCLAGNARAGDRCSSQDTLSRCAKQSEAKGCAYCIAPAVTNAIDHNCRAWDYPPDDRRIGVFDCGWTAVGARNGDWYAQSYEEVKKDKDMERAVKAALWDDPQVKGWLDDNLGYWKKGNPWAGLEAGCAFGCQPEVAKCEPNCPLNEPAIKTCYNLVQAIAPRVTHHIYHHCKDRILWGHAEHIVDCGYGQTMADDYGEALAKGLIKKCKNEDELKKLLYDNDDVKAMVKQHLAYWHDGNAAADAELLLGDPRGPALRGPTVGSNWYDAEVKDDPKACQKYQPKFSGNDANYYPTPPNMLDWTPTKSDLDTGVEGFNPPAPASREQYKLAAGHIGSNEGRLNAELRAVAAKADPIHALCMSARQFGVGDAAYGNAYADLAVTGRASFQRFREAAPKEATLRAAGECKGVADGALTKALDRAYKVAIALRNGKGRRALGWIAVSGEDDQPYRPVNVPATPFPQFNLVVDVPGKPSVNTRYSIAHAHPRPQTFQQPSRPLVDGGPGRQVPDDPLPGLEPDAEVLLFIHGMDSRLEESLDLTRAMHALAKKSGKNWTLITMDLPSSGYADNIDNTLISPLAAINHDHNRAVPLVDFLEEFIVHFVDKLDEKIHVKGRIRAVVGGSLGGAMSMRLGRRTDLPWVHNVIPWSPASIWPSFDNDVWSGTGDVSRPYKAVEDPLGWAALSETPVRRTELFYGSFDWAPMGMLRKVGIGAPPQAACWFSDHWPCKAQVILGARLDRHETYNANFRRWHWRLGAELLVYSQQETSPPGHGINDKFPAHYWNNTIRMMLTCGDEDQCVALCPITQTVAGKMYNTPGTFRHLAKTGHSLDNEHPEWVAQQIVDFLK